MKCNLKLIVMPSIVEKCEGCGSGPKEDIKDLELRNGTRQVARVFMCKTCREATGKLVTEVK
jgi:hypothetical protein